MGRVFLALRHSRGATNALLAPDSEPADANVAGKPASAPTATPPKLEPNLNAIRVAISDPIPQHAGPAPVQIAVTAHRGTMVAHALLAIQMLFAWPRGAVRAIVDHLDGSDLRGWP